MPAPGLLNPVREPDCWAVTQTVKYYRVGSMCIKRTLREHEWITIDNTLLTTPETVAPQRWRNDAAIMDYVRAHTDIPVPKVLCLFEDDGAFYHCTEYVPGVGMDKLSQEQQALVMPELLRHITSMKTLTSDTPWVPPLPRSSPPPEDEDFPRTLSYEKPEPPLLVGPPSVSNLKWKSNSCWRPRKDVRGRFVLCHNDLDTHNVLVDPETLKITAILDWEYAAFLPEWFEQRFWETTLDDKGERRSLRGHASAEDREEYTWRCREWLMEHCEEVEIPDLLTLKDKLGDEMQPIIDQRAWTRNNIKKQEKKAWEEWKEKKQKKQKTTAGEEDHGEK